MAVKEVNKLLSDLWRRVKQIATEDGDSFMSLEELNQWMRALQDANDAGPDVVEKGDSVTVVLKKKKTD